jgi:hypothetical protein
MGEDTIIEKAGMVERMNIDPRFYNVEPADPGTDPFIGGGTSNVDGNHGN